MKKWKVTINTAYYKITHIIEAKSNKEAIRIFSDRFILDNLEEYVIFCIKVV